MKFPTLHWSFRNHLVRRILFLLVAFSITPALIMGALIYLRARMVLPLEVIYQEFNAVLFFAGLTFLAALPGVILIAWLAALQLTHPIVELIAAAQHFTAGDHSQRILIHEKDEIGRLASLFNQMAYEIEQLERPPEVKSEGCTEEDLIPPFEMNLLYRATHQIAQAKTVEEVYLAAHQALLKAPYLSTFLIVEGDCLRPILPTQSGASLSNCLPVPAEAIAAAFDASLPFLVVSDPASHSNLPVDLIEIPRRLGCETAAYLPVFRGGLLAALLIVGTHSRKERRLTPGVLQPYANLAELFTTTLEKIQALHRMEERLNDLLTLGTISQSISMETDLHTLYEVIHRQIHQVMGGVDFLIALYDPERDEIHIPYMAEEQSLIQVPSFPLGEGLTSILIRTRQPLMLVADTERRIRELGAKTIGKPAKSWLGVPLVLRGEAIGAIVVQDLATEHRFDENDQRLLMTLAGQVAVAVRNARLLESTRKQAERERLINQITSKIRRSTDIETILKTTTEELALALNLRRAQIRLHSESSSLPDEANRPTSRGDGGFPE